MSAIHFVQFPLKITFIIYTLASSSFRKEFHYAAQIFWNTAKSRMRGLCIVNWIGDSFLIQATIWSKASSEPSFSHIWTFIFTLLYTFSIFEQSQSYLYRHKVTHSYATEFRCHQKNKANNWMDGFRFNVYLLSSEGWRIFLHCYSIKYSRRFPVWFSSILYDPLHLDFHVSLKLLSWISEKF